jgi:hypothetical protein
LIIGRIEHEQAHACRVAAEDGEIEPAIDLLYTQGQWTAALDMDRPFAAVAAGHCAAHGTTICRRRRSSGCGEAGTAVVLQANRRKKAILPA